jgi:hypothetical protein
MRILPPLLHQHQHQRSVSIRIRGYWKLILLSLLSLTFVFRLLTAVHILETTALSSSSSSVAAALANSVVGSHEKRTHSTSIIYVLVTSADALSTFGTSRHDSFCTSWNQSQLVVDDWWSQTPDYELAHQNVTHQCFRPIQNPKKAALFRKLYATQFPPDNNNNNNASSSCSSVYTKLVTNSGWGLDLSHAVDGLLYAADHGQPVQLVNRGPWQYAEQVCPKEDWSCYFLPLTSCSASSRHEKKTSWRDADAAMQGKYLYEWRGFYRLKSVRWILEYVTRGQQWIREQAAVQAATVELQTPCTVIHVRRADVVLHGRWSRRYHAIHEYLDALQQTKFGRLSISPLFGSRNILLLTDDSNAVTEAVQHHTSYHWMYLTRYRHKGASGGWENQIPSKHPADEVAALLASTELIKKCDCLVHSKSNLADYYYAIMKEANPGVMRIDLDADKDHDEIHRETNADTVRLSLGSNRR